MKLFTWRRYNYTADFYDYTIQNDANGTLSYFLKGPVEIDFMNDPSAPRVVILSDKPLRRKSQLANIRGRDGKELLPGAIYLVTTVEVVLNPFGKREGFRMRAALANEPEFDFSEAD